MDESKFYAEMAAILEVPTVKPDDIVIDFKLWDSLTELTVLAMLGSKFGVNLTGDDMVKARTAGELWALVQQR